jgi:hypothetical protein
MLPCVVAGLFAENLKVISHLEEKQTQEIKRDSHSVKVDGFVSDCVFISVRK